MSDRLKAWVHWVKASGGGDPISDDQLLMASDIEQLTTERDRLAEALKGLMPFLKCSDDIGVTMDVYYTPAQELRNRAFQIEQQDAAIKKARAALKTALDKD